MVMVVSEASPHQGCIEPLVAGRGHATPAPLVQGVKLMLVITKNTLCGFLTQKKMTHHPMHTSSSNLSLNLEAAI